MKKLYVAYGSNLNKLQMAYRCPNAKEVGTSYIDGYRLKFKGSGTGSYLTIEKAKGYRVPVGIWEVSESDIERLDVYEGYPAFYYKKSLKLPLNRFGKGAEKMVNAFVYIMHEDRRLGMPSNYYVETCLEGYDDFGFDPAYLQDALQLSYDDYLKKFQKV